MAQLANMADELTYNFIVEGVAPGRHAGSAADGQAAQFDSVEQLLIGSSFQISGFGVVAWRHRQKGSVDAVALAFQSMALGAVKLIPISRFLSDW